MGMAGRVAFGFLAVFLTISVVLLVTGCSHTPRPSPNGLLERFVPLMNTAGRSHFRNPVVIDRAGSKRTAMVLVAPAAVRAPLESMPGRIEFSLEVVPVFNVGDGVQMEIWLREGVASSRVYSRYFDPGWRFEDRRWTPVTVAMDVHCRDAQVEIRVSGGPEGNLTGDWLAFADLRISRKAEAQ